MAQLAILRAPGDIVVMAFTTKSTFDDVCHQNVVGARAYLKSNFSMTNPATKADAVKPVREDYWSHASLFRSLVKHHITVFGRSRG